MTDREKEFINLNKRYLKLTYQRAQCKISVKNLQMNFCTKLRT